MTKLAMPEEDGGELLLYRGPDGAVRIEAVLMAETVWLTQKRMAELFDVDKSGISRHLKSIFETGELDAGSVVAKIATTAADGKTYQVEHYNLDAIIAVGYRVNSYQATQFRIWATGVLREFLIKGFVMDDERLKQGSSVFGEDYFEQLLERIREIRASERRFYQKITDIYATAADYDKDAPITRQFFATVQNKLHWAITGQTAAETIYKKADAALPNMGLTSWKQSPDGKVLKSDVSVAKNYLEESHLRELNQIVSAYLDLAENRARRGKLMKMTDWATFLDGFLALSDYPILADKGKVSALQAKLKAEAEYEKFRIRQDREYLSDFDKQIKRLEQERKDNDSDPAEDEP